MTDAALWAALQAGNVAALGEAIRDIHGREAVQFHLEPTPRYGERAVLVDGERVATCRFEPEIGWYCISEEQLASGFPTPEACGAQLPRQ